MPSDFFDPPAQVRSVEDAKLSQLVEAIKVDINKAQLYEKKSLLRYRNAGRKLLEAKQRLPHGGWLPWLETKVGVTRETARQWMRLAKNWDKLKGSNVRLTLHLTAALALLDQLESREAESRETPISQGENGDFSVHNLKDSSDDSGEKPLPKPKQISQPRPAFQDVLLKRKDTYKQRHLKDARAILEFDDLFAFWAREFVKLAERAAALEER